MTDEPIKPPAEAAREEHEEHETGEEADQARDDERDAKVIKQALSAAAKKSSGPLIIGPKEPPAPPRPKQIEKRPALFLAEYPTVAKCLHAAEKLRDAGYKHFDTHTPFPVHGMDAAMGLTDSKLGWIVLAGGLTGVTTAVTMIWWMNGVDYPIIIGGKPGFALPSSVPIMFELTVLFSAFAAVFGMFGLNKLPRHHHPIFESERFRGATDDKFFVSVEKEDPKFDLARTRKLLEQTHPENIELIEEEFEVHLPHEDHS